jgi:DNA-binding LacI/PurR family transcriptional regulator
MDCSAGIIPYRKLYEQLRNDIRNGILCGKLPSIAEFSRDYGVSHNTVKKVLDRLKEQRYVYGMQGKGVFVNEAVTGSPAFQKTIVFYLHMEAYRNPFFLKAFSRLRKLLEDEQSIVHLVNSPKQLQEIADQVDVMVTAVSNQQEMDVVCRCVEPTKIIFFNAVCNSSCCINTDNIAGGYMAMEYLYRHGHRKIGLISRDLSIKNCYFDYRYQGCMQFASAHPDLEIINSEMKISSSIPDEDSARNATLKLFKKASDITAIFAFTDILALGVVSHCHNHGIRLPDDISLLGFDNRDFSPALFPPLTTLQEDLDEMLRLTMVNIGKAVKNELGIGITGVKPFLVERSSVKSI